ncbi:MAG: hypothetical protein IPN76_14860 [Saprospiraceae bacterium]|nr:hypothetical protein [Saprospiraceae bacterium]
MDYHRDSVVTVGAALRKGQLMVNLPVFAFIVIIPAAGLFFQSISAWVLLVGMIAGIGFAWLWWSFFIVKWRLWAFKNVRNVHELKTRAIQKGLIWPDDSFFNKTEIWNDEDKAEWQLIQRKFKIEDIYEDDSAVPREAIIYFSKTKNYAEMAVFLFVLGFGLFSLLVAKEWLFGLPCSILGVYLTLRSYKKAANNSPQIILTDNGIMTANTQFHPWRLISNETVVQEQNGKYVNIYLIYYHPGGKEKISIDDYDTNYDKLHHLLKTYRLRSNNLKNT